MSVTLSLAATLMKLNMALLFIGFYFVLLVSDCMSFDNLSEVKNILVFLVRKIVTYDGRLEEYIFPG